MLLCKTMFHHKLRKRNGFIPSNVKNFISLHLQGCITKIAEMAECDKYVLLYVRHKISKNTCQQLIAKHEFLIKF